MYLVDMSILSILLRGSGSHIIQVVVLELSVVVSSYTQDLHIMLMLNFIGKFDDGPLHPTVLLKEIYSCVS